MHAQYDDARLCQPRVAWLGGLGQPLDEKGNELPKTPCITLNLTLGGFLADELPKLFHLVRVFQGHLLLLSSWM